MKLPFRVIIAVIILSGFIPASSGYPSPDERAEKEKPVVSFGLIPLYTPRIMYERFQPLMDYLSANTPYKFRMKLTKDYNGIITLLKNDSIDIALLGGVTYIVAGGRAKLIPLLKPLDARGKPFYRSVIITRDDNTIKSIHDIRGRSFAFASRWSTSGSMVPLYNLYFHGIELRDLSRYSYLKHQDSVIREVLKGNYDAGAVMDNILHAYKDKGLRIVFTSEPVPELIIVARKGMPRNILDSTKKALLALSAKDQAHMEILRGWAEDIRYGFVEADDPDFDGIRSMMDYLNGKGIYVGKD